VRRGPVGPPVAPERRFWPKKSASGLSKLPTGQQLKASASFTRLDAETKAAAERARDAFF
jgi:hypothetical protein